MSSQPELRLSTKLSQQECLDVHSLAGVKDMVPNLLTVEVQLEGTNACSVGPGAHHALTERQGEIAA